MCLQFVLEIGDKLLLQKQVLLLEITEDCGAFCSKEDYITEKERLQTQQREGDTAIHHLTL